MNLRFINPEHLHDDWDFLKDCIIKVLEKTKDKHMKVEDVYWLLKANNCGAYIIEEKIADPWIRIVKHGMVILQPCKGWDGQELFVFMGYNSGEKEIVKFCDAEIEKIARTMSARRVRWQSVRAGAQRMAESLGYQRDYVVYSKELS